MDGNICAPGPTPSTVRAADGTVLTAPEGWSLLPPGDAGLTRRVKAAGELLQRYRRGEPVGDDCPLQRALAADG